MATNHRLALPFLLAQLAQISPAGPERAGCGQPIDESYPGYRCSTAQQQPGQQVTPAHHFESVIPRLKALLRTPMRASSRRSAMA